MYLSRQPIANSPWGYVGGGEEMEASTTYTRYPSAPRENRTSVLILQGHTAEKGRTRYPSSWNLPGLHFGFLATTFLVITALISVVILRIMDPVGETVPFSHFAGCFTFEAIGAGACSVRARPAFRSFLGLSPCLSVWCFLSLRHLSAEAFGGRRTQVRKWRCIVCSVD